MKTAAKTAEQELADFLSDALQDYLDDDRPTTPGEMQWVECDCQTVAPRFAPAACEVCGGGGYKLTTVERTA